MPTPKFLLQRAAPGKIAWMPLMPAAGKINLNDPGIKHSTPGVQYCPNLEIPRIACANNIRIYYQ